MYMYMYFVIQILFPREARLYSSSVDFFIVVVFMVHPTLPSHFFKL